MKKIIATLLMASVSFSSMASDTEKTERKKGPQHKKGGHMNPDTNKDDVLSDEELSIAADKLAEHFPKMKKRFEKAIKEQKKKAERIQKFLAIDANNDGTIDSAEKEALKSQIKEKFAKMQKHMLKKFDSNKDGKIDDSEREAMKKTWADKKTKMLEKFDLDKDGKLSADEKKSMRETFKKERAEKKKKKGGKGFDKVYE